MLDKKNFFKENMYPLEFLLKLLNKLNKNNKNNKRIFLLLLDILTILISIVLVFFFGSELNYLVPISIFPIIIFTSIFIYSFTGQYNSLTRYLLTSEIFNIALRNILILLSLVYIWFDIEFKNNQL